MQALKQTLLIVGDTELLSVPPLLTVYDQAPTLNHKITALAIMQDEIGHAHIAYRLLKDLGENVDSIVYDRPANKWKKSVRLRFRAGKLGGARHVQRFV